MTPLLKQALVCLAHSRYYLKGKVGKKDLNKAVLQLLDRIFPQPLDPSKTKINVAFKNMDPTFKAFRHYLVRY